MRHPYGAAAGPNRTHAARAANTGPPGLSGQTAHADLVQPAEQVGRVGVHPVRAAPFQLLAAVPAGQQADAEVFVARALTI
jgi:hypothetical protein